MEKLISYWTTKTEFIIGLCKQMKIVSIQSYVRWLSYIKFLKLLRKKKVIALSVILSVVDDLGLLGLVKKIFGLFRYYLVLVLHYVRWEICRFKDLILSLFLGCAYLLSIWF